MMMTEWDQADFDEYEAWVNAETPEPPEDDTADRLYDADEDEFCPDSPDTFHHYTHHPAEPDVGIRYPYSECNLCGDQR